MCFNGNLRYGSVWTTPFNKYTEDIIHIFVFPKMFG